MVSIVDHDDDHQTTLLWTASRQSENAAILAEFHALPQHYGGTTTTSAGLWRHSLDPKNEKGIPVEYRSWEHWSNHFEMKPRFGSWDLTCEFLFRNVLLGSVLYFSGLWVWFGLKV